MNDRQRFALSQLARFQRGITWSKTQEIAEPEPGSVPVLRIPNIQERLDTTNLIWLKGVEKASLQQYAAAKDWILMVGSNGNPDRVGNCVLITEQNEYLFASFLIGIEPIDKKKAIPEFLFQILRGPEIQRFISDDVQGSTGLSNINLSRLKAKVVDCPSPPVQHRIAEILTALDETIEQTQALITKHQQIKAGLMHDLFTRGVTPDGRLRPTREEAPQLYKESPLGWIPQGWKTVLLDQLALRGSGHTPNKNNPDYWNGGIKWVSLADSWRLDRVYISDTDKEISELGIANSSAVLHPPGVVVLSRDAGVGKSAITTSSMAVSQHFMCWRCGPQLDNHYLYYWLQDRKREFENIATGSTIPTIGLRFFKHYRISVPEDIKEQKKIGACLLSLDQQIFASQEDLRKKTTLKSGLMHDLLTGRVRIKVLKAAAA